MALERNLESLCRRIEVRQRLLVDGDRPVPQLGVLARVFEPEELSEVIAPGGSLVASGRGDSATVLLGLTSEGLVDLAHRLPVRAPVLPLGRLPHRPVEVVDVDAVGDEACPPVVCRHLDPRQISLPPCGGGSGWGVGFYTHLTLSFRWMACSRLEPKSCNRIAAQLRPGRPETDPPGWVQAPVW